MRGKLPNIWNRYFALIIGSTLMTQLGMPIITPSLPAVQRALGVADADIGLIMAVYSLPALVFVPLLSLVADRFSKKWVVVPSLVLFTAGGFAFTAENFETLLWLRFIQGLGASGLSGIALGLVGDYFRSEDRIRVLANISFLQNVGAGVLPVIGGALALIAWDVPYLASFLTIPLALFGLVVMKPGDNTPAPGGTALLGHAWRNITDRRALELMGMTGGFILVGFGVFVTYIPTFLANNFATGSLIIGIIVGARSVSGAIMSSRITWLMRTVPPRWLIFSAFLVQSAGLAVVPVLPNDWSVMIAALCYGGAFGIVRPALQIMMLENAPEDLRATFGGGIAVSLRFAQTIGPLIAGLVIGAWGFGPLFFGAAVVPLLLALYALRAEALKPAMS